MSGQTDVAALLQGPQNNNNNKPAPVGKQHGNKMASPLFLLILGLGALLLGISTSMFDIQASEAIVVGGQLSSFTPNWQLLSQVPQIVAGRELPANLAASYYVGWIIELASLILIVCFDLAKAALIHAPRWAVTTFEWGIYGIAALDVITNYAYMPGIPAWYVRLFVAGLIAVSSFFFPIIGVYCLEMGVRNW